MCKGWRVEKRRLDTLLAERGLFPSRSRAAASVMAGEVLVGEPGRPASKPGEMVGVQEQLVVKAAPEFVSRGGRKLANALDDSRLAVAGRRALDVGASTGGFTDCLLQRGAASVIAVDVGYGILDYRLRTDPRVTVLERTNARELTPAMLADVGAGAPEIAVVDVSFISLTKVIGPVIACLAPGWEMLAMVKPQFEVGRGRVGKGGVVREPVERRRALVEVAGAAIALGAAVVSFHSSGLPGPKGNRETFLRLADPGLGTGTREQAGLEELARRAEP